MELTPQQIDEACTEAEIARQVKHSFATPLRLAAMEKRALKEHPPVFRQTVPVPPMIRNAETELVKPKRQPKIKKHVLP